MILSWRISGLIDLIQKGSQFKILLVNIVRRFQVSLLIKLQINFRMIRIWYLWNKKLKRFQSMIYLYKKCIGQIEIFQNIKRWLKLYFLDDVFFASCMFLVRGIVDKIKEMTNNKVIPTRLQKVRLESSNSPNDTVRYKFNLNVLIND